jgi:hypothetical protein
MSGPLDPENSFRGEKKDQRPILAFDHDQFLSDRVSDVLNYLRDENIRHIGLNHFLADLLKLHPDDSGWNLKTTLNIYQQGFAERNPDFEDQYRKGVTACGARVNPAFLITRLMGILLQQVEAGHINLLKSDPRAETIQTASELYIEILSNSALSLADTQEMEAIDPAMMNLDEDKILHSPADTQPIQPLR